MISSIYSFWQRDTNAPFVPTMGSGVKRQRLLISLSGALAISAIGFSNAYSAEKPKLCSCSEARVSLLKNGFKNVQAASCKAPYQFNATKDNCSYVVKVTAECKWTAVTSCSDTSVGTVGGQ